jgi:alpha-beta hydrolase superfamily lysophospholipase
MTRQQRYDHQVGLFDAHDGASLFEQTWQPRRVSGVVAIVHGVAEHSGRYAQTAHDLCAAGYAVTCFDLRGHGRSEGLPTFVSSFDAYLDDLALFLERARRRCAGQPLFLLGHSMGGQIAALYAIERQPHLAGLILSGPAVRLGLDESPALIGFVRGLNALFPRLPFLKLRSAGLSQDAAVVSDYDSDPLVYRGGLRPATLLAFRDASARIQAGIERLTLPLLVLHGADDTLVPAAGSRELVAHAGSPDKTLCVYDGLYHEVLNEPGRGVVLADLIAWLDAHR